MSESVLSAAAFARHVNTEGGASRSFGTLQPASAPGVMVSHAGSEKVSSAPLTEYEAKKYMHEHEVQAVGGHDYHGAWTHQGKVYQDVSRKYESLPEARKAGEANKQIAGYDLGGTDVRRPEGGNVYFGRSLPGEESSEEWKQTATGTGVGERLSPKPTSQERVEQMAVNRGATRRNRAGKQVPVTINEVLDTIAAGRRKK